MLMSSARTGTTLLRYKWAQQLWSLFVASAVIFAETVLPQLHTTSDITLQEAQCRQSMSSDIARDASCKKLCISDMHSYVHCNL